MFLYSGPDFVPEALPNWIKTAESGIYSDDAYCGTIKYCIVTLFGNKGRREGSLVNVVLAYNRMLPEHQRIILKPPTPTTTGETLPIAELVVGVKKGRSHTVMHKCLLDKQHDHPAYRRWVNPVAPVGQ